MAPTDPRVLEGVERLRRREWYAAHDAFEAAWHEATGERRTFLQGLIHVAVSLEHLRRGNPRGARSQWRKARRKLHGHGARPEGLDLESWCEEVTGFFAAIDLDARAAAQDRGEPPAPLPVVDEWPVPR